LLVLIFAALTLVAPTTLASAPAAAPGATPSPGFSIRLGSGRVISYESRKTVDANGATKTTRSFQITPKTNKATGAPKGRGFSWNSEKVDDGAGTVTKSRDIHYESNRDNGVRTIDRSTMKTSRDGTVIGKSRDFKYESGKTLRSGDERLRVYQTSKWQT